MHYKMSKMPEAKKISQNVLKFSKKKVPFSNNEKIISVKFDFQIL